MGVGRDVEGRGWAVWMLWVFVTQEALRGSSGCRSEALRQSLFPPDRALGSGGGDAPAQRPGSGGSLARAPGTGTGATGAVPAATAEATAGAPETGAPNTSMYSPQECLWKGDSLAHSDLPAP